MQQAQRKTINDMTHLDWVAKLPEGVTARMAVYHDGRLLTSIIRGVRHVDMVLPSGPIDFDAYIQPAINNLIGA